MESRETSVLQVDLKTAFNIYAAKVGRNGCLTRSRFRKLLIEAFIITEESGITVVEVEDIITANLGDWNCLDFEQFQKCVEELVKEKQLDRDEVFENLIGAAKSYEEEDEVKQKN